MAMPTRMRLILLSCLMLFVELALIRWTGSNIVYLSYFSNFVLLGSFLGIGVGFLRGRARTNLFPCAPAAVAIFVALVLVFPVEIDRSGSDLIYFAKFGTTGLPIWLTLPAVFIAVAAIMGMIAEGVARTFVQFEPLEAYRYDIVGNLLGIAAFSALSFSWAPPVAWGLVVAGLFLVLLRPRIGLVQAVALLALVLALGFESASSSTSWSPYYKVTTGTRMATANATMIEVNGIPHQAVMTVEDRRRTEPLYFVPYERAQVSSLDDVLTVGAGTGTDVAIALAQGARHVDAVEIDPRLQQIGAELHPDRPYDDPRVSVWIDDGRAFLERTGGSV